ncbi:MAG: amidohydrolase [Candidatus Bilamarchaeaceae archaeon]
MILIKDATIVAEKIFKGDILIVENRIEEIGKNIEERTEETIDARGKIAIPGLVNTHTHIAMTLLRGYGEDLPLHEWLQKKIWPAEARLSAKDVRWGSLLGIIECIKSGVTAFNDMYIYYVEETVKAALEAGIRISVPRAMFDLVPGRETKKELSAATEFVKKWKGTNDLVIPIVSCHAPYTCSEELLINAKELANREGLKFHIHLSETRKEVFDILNTKRKYPFEYMDSLGLVDENSIFAHAGWVTTREIALAGKKGASISHCPVSNLKLAIGGICPISEFDAAGANVTIGTDSAASNNSLNMFESMKIAALLQKHQYWEADAIPLRKIFEFGTKNGARALGLNSGGIEKGKLADIVLLERSSNLLPEYDLVANIVYSGGPQNVSDVIINGKIVMKDKKVLTLDEEAINEEAKGAAEALAARLL